MSAPSLVPEQTVASCSRRKSPRTSGPTMQRARRSTRRRLGKPDNKPEPPEDEFTDSTRLFFSALHAGDVATVEDLLDKREVHVNGRNIEDVTSPTPLLVACERQHYDVIHTLLTAIPQPANVNLENNRGKRPIWWAAKYGDHEMAQMLLEARNQQCEVNYLDKESGCTPLCRAILANSTEVCAALIHAGADVNLRHLGTSGDSATAESPLIKAVLMNNLAIVDMLVDSLCDMDARTEDGLTALHYAVAYRRYAIAHTLLTNKIPVSAKSTCGATAMTVAIEQHNNAAMVHMLVTHGYNPDQKFDWGETPLEMAINNHSQPCALVLVYEGCSLTVEDDKPSYFLQAISEGLFNLVKVLLAVKGSYFSEEWLQQRFIPLALYKRPKYYEALFDQASNARPLRAICRSVIFCALGRFPIKKAHKLPLPRKLKDYVKLKKEFPKNLFAESSIYDDDCPYDCPYSCTKTQCIDLDFSSSSEDELNI